MSNQDQEILKAQDGAIKVIYQNQVIEPYDEESFIKIDFIVDEENAEDLELDEAGYLVDIRRIHGLVNIGDPESALSFIAKIDTEFKGWKINFTRVVRIDGAIFPHEIEINLDSMTILLKFDVFS